MDGYAAIKPDSLATDISYTLTSWGDN
ncbi:hypothetical protein CCACVL1_28895 [Corchorus capsularis]|uniref:Uncharacterized protein n=1 Tax=Corchorus capsularis TaxID=210143 RepID=A0A1R3G4U3_COCAP|nr:hypothetical protein CCACVL1_28895 [Corchorus capsularis]